MTILVTGVAGFVGAYVARALLAKGHQVVGLDNLSPYYDVGLKRARLNWLKTGPGSDGAEFHFSEQDLGDKNALKDLDKNYGFNKVVHLAAQPGVRYSLENPQAYIDANVTGHLNVLEMCRHSKQISLLVYASSSSVYGGNEKLPFQETDPVNNPVSLYAATKRADELISASYSQLYGIQQIGLRFFTVYGPWGRPDMAPWLFTDAIFHDRPIRIFNHGDMRRDFTYIDDIVDGVCAAVISTPTDPHAIYNLGNNRSEDLMQFIKILEQHIGKKAIKEFTDMQPGDVKDTYADIDKSRAEFGFQPETTLDAGLKKFVDWFAEYHSLNAELL